MATLPRRNSELLAFCVERAPIWALSGASLGLNSSQTAGFTSVTGVAETAYATQQSAIQSAQGASAAAHQAMDAMRQTAGELLKVIRAYAETAADPALVYQTAKIPPTKTPAPIGPPGKPFEFALSVDDLGKLHLKWKCKNPAGVAGVLYMVERRIAPATGFTFLAASAERQYIDASVPAGTSMVEYAITAHRAGTVGLPGTWTVRFGGASGGSEGVASGGQFSIFEGGGKIAA